MAPLLALDDVSKSYGALKVTDELSLAVHEGEALGILGPNGAGKTTLFNLITGDVRPTAAASRSTAATSRRCRRTSAARPASAAPTRSRSRSASMTVFENLLVGATFGGGQREAEVVRPLRRGAASHRPAAARPTRSPAR